MIAIRNPIDGELMVVETFDPDAYEGWEEVCPVSDDIAARIGRAELMWGDDGFVQNLPLLRQRKRAAIDARRDALLHGGYRVTEGPLAGQVLQNRVEDRVNWTISRVQYGEAVAAGLGDEPGAAFRTLSNETFTLTFAEGLAVLKAMNGWGLAVLTASWALKGQVEAAETAEDIAAVDIEQGWPAESAAIFQGEEQ